MVPDICGLRHMALHDAAPLRTAILAPLIPAAAAECVSPYTLSTATLGPYQHMTLSKQIAGRRLRQRLRRLQAQQGNSKQGNNKLFVSSRNALPMGNTDTAPDGSAHLMLPKFSQPKVRPSLG